MTVSGHVGPRWLIGRVTEASLLANVRQHWLSDEAEFRDLGIRVEVRHRLNRRMTASLDASRHERRYDERTHLDGPLTDISAGVGWVATPTVRIDTAAGWGSQRTERERERHSRRWVRLGVTAHLPWGFTVGGVPPINSVRCQRRSKISPPGRSKTSPLNVMRYAVLGGCPGSP